MNPRAEGAIEALAWVLHLLDNVDDISGMREAVSSAREDLLCGVSIDFRDRIRPR